MIMGELVVERVAQLAHDEADRVRRPPAAQVAGERVRPEAQPLGRREHAVDGVGRDEVAVREDAGHRLRAHSGEPGDVFECRALLNRHRSGPPCPAGFTVALDARDVHVGHSTDIDRREPFSV
jgi:hypothetical protein